MALESIPHHEAIKLLESDLPKLVISGQLSNASHFTLRVEGPFNQREKAALMKLLETQMEILEEDG